MLLMTLSFLLGVFQPVIAGPDRPGVTGDRPNVVGDRPNVTGDRPGVTSGTRTYSAGCYTVTVSYIKNNQQADGVTNDIVLVTVTDGGALINNVPVKFTVSGNSGSTTWPTGTNGYTNGTAQFFLNSQSTTPIPIKIEVPNDCSPTPETAIFTYTANPPNSNPSSGSSNPSYYKTIIQTAPADGNSPTQVELHVTDGTNNLPQGTPIKFVVTGGNPAAAAAGAMMGGATAPGVTYNGTLPDNSGTIDLPIKDATAGDVTIEAFAWDAINGVWVSFGTQTVTFTIAPPNANPPPGSTNPSYYKTIIQSAIADGNSPTQVELHVTDGTNNLPQGTQVKFVITSTNKASGAAVMGGSSGGTYNGTLPDNSGTIDLTIKDLIVGDVTIQAFAWDNTTSTWISFGTQTVSFVAGAPVAGDPSGGGSGGTPPADGGVLPGNGDGGGTGGPGSNDGGGNGNNTGPGDNKNFTLLFVRQDFQLGNGKAQDSLIAKITDGLPNPNGLPGYQVDFYIQSTPFNGTATSFAQFAGNPIGVVTADSGYARIAITSSKPGTVYVYAVLEYLGVIIDGSSQMVTFTDKPDVNNPKTMLSTVIYEALADGSQQTAVKAHVVGMDGTDMVGLWVKFAIDSGSADFVGPDSVMTDGNGDAIIYLTSKKVGDASVTATAAGLPITNNSPARVKFAMINIYVPKVFTPNNDGTNDVLKPILVGIQTFRYFSVYNRWGNLIYTTQDANQGWDGTFKGVAQPVETYLWMAEGVDVTGKKIVAKGMTSLVR